MAPEKLPEVQQNTFQKYQTYKEAMNYIRSEEPDIKAKWYGTQAENNRRKCPALHDGSNSIAKTSLVLAVDYNTVIKNLDGKYGCKRSRRYFGI